MDFIEHFDKEELIPLTQLIFNSLCNNGKLILQTPNGEGLFPRQIIYGDLTHLTIFTPGTLQQILSYVGFYKFHFLETGPVSKDILGVLRVILWKLVKVTANSIRLIETGKKQVVWTENMICSCFKPDS